MSVTLPQNMGRNQIREVSAALNGVLVTPKYVGTTFAYAATPLGGCTNDGMPPEYHGS